MLDLPPRRRSPDYALQTVLSPGSHSGFSKRNVGDHPDWGRLRSCLAYSKGRSILQMITYLLKDAYRGQHTARNSPHLTDVGAGYERAIF